MKKIFKRFLLLVGISVLGIVFVNSKVIYAKTYISTNEGFYAEKNPKLVKKIDLENGYQYIDNHKEFKVDSDILIENVVYKHSDEYVVLGRSAGVAYIAYYKEGNMIFESKELDSINGRFVDAIFEDDKIVLLGEIRKSDKVNRILIEEYSYNGLSLRKQELYGDNDSFSKKMFKINGYYFFMGETMSKEIDGCYNDSLRSIFIGRISEMNFSDYYIVSFGNKNINTLYDAVCLNNELFLLINFTGKGYFLSGNTSTDFFSLVRFDEQLDMPLYQSLKLEKGDENSKITTDSENVLLVSIVDKNKVGISKWNRGLDKIDYFEYDVLKISDKIDRIDAFYENKCLAIITSFNDNESLVENKIILDEENNKIFDSGLSYSENKKIAFVNYNDYFFNIVYLGLTSDEYEMKSETNIKIKNDNLLLNGKKINSKNKDKENEIFGSDEEYLEYITKDLNILISSTKTAVLKTNVKNFSVYDKGIKLEFNAIGYLNGKKIENNYEVLECGNYLLELYGASDEKESIYFIVEELTVDCENEEIRENVNFEIEETLKREINNLSIANNNIDQDIIKVKNDWSYLIVAVILGIVMGIILSKVLNRRIKHA